MEQPMIEMISNAFLWDCSIWENRFTHKNVKGCNLISPIKCIVTANHQLWPVHFRKPAPRDDRTDLWLAPCHSFWLAVELEMVLDVSVSFLLNLSDQSHNLEALSFTKDSRERDALNTMWIFFCGQSF